MRSIIFTVFLLLWVHSGTSFVSRTATKLPIRSFRCPSQTDTDVLVEAGLQWLAREPIARIIPADGVKISIEEYRNNTELWDKAQPQFESLWGRVESYLRLEKKSFKTLLGPTLSKQLLEFTESVDVYDPKIVGGFLAEPAIELALSSILYDGIFEFLQRVDIMGNIVNNLPVIGPIRQAITAEFKRQLDKVLGPQIKVFLSSYNRIAVQRITDFVLSPTNRKAFSKANRNLVDAILSRSPASLMPPPETSRQLKEKAWNSLRSEGVNITDIIDTLYAQLGSSSISEFADITAALTYSPTARQLLGQALLSFLRSPEGQKSLSLAPLVIENQ